MSCAASPRRPLSRRQAVTRPARVPATAHCLTGCAIGEVLGMVIATALGWGAAASIALAIVLAFFFGYALTLVPVLRAGVVPLGAPRLALASDTLSILTMELVDNAFILLVPGAIAAGLGDSLFWLSLAAQPGGRLRRDVPGQPLADRARARSRGGARAARPLSVTVAAPRGLRSPACRTTGSSTRPTTATAGARSRRRSRARRRQRARRSRRTASCASSARRAAAAARR